MSRSPQILGVFRFGLLDVAFVKEPGLTPVFHFFVGEGDVKEGQGDCPVLSPKSKEVAVQGLFQVAQMIVADTEVGPGDSIIFFIGKGPLETEQSTLPIGRIPEGGIPGDCGSKDSVHPILGW
jgi:hypothetical protein